MLTMRAGEPPADSDWAPYEPSDAAPWDLRRVVHLHRRAAFAAPWSRLELDLKEGPAPAIDRLLSGKADDASSGFETLARTIGDAAAASGSAARLKAWWLYRMLLTPDPLGERLTLMWHNHFATSNRKVQDLVRMREQNDIMRQFARAPFGELLSAVIKHPAMLVWLDAESNRRGHANENLAREAMELFTLGVGHYTERDVQEAARALTGWSITANRFEFVAARHDDGEKTILGRTGRISGDDLLAMLLGNPATAKRLAWRISKTFLGEGVAKDAALEQLAEGLRAHDLDTAWAIDTVIRSKLFFSEANLRSRVLGPVEYLVGALRALELCQPPPSTLLLSEWSARMGQDLFYPPNVGGWNEGRAWLSSRAIVARANFADALVRGQLWQTPRDPNLSELPARHGQSAELAPGVAWFTRLLWGEVPPAVAEEIASASKSADSPLAHAVARLLARPEHQLA
jgi:uncharacterized protein (DUF1800 family)